MAQQKKPKRGRPRMRETTTTFGMKLSPRERELIRRRAARAGKSASRYLLDLVAKDSEAMQPVRQAPSAIELMQLPAEDRRKLLSQQAKIAAPYYRNDPDLNFEIYDDILEY